LKRRRRLKIKGTKTNEINKRRDTIMLKTTKEKREDNEKEEEGNQR
jgi:hypothetical protein